MVQWVTNQSLFGELGRYVIAKLGFEFFYCSGISQIEGTLLYVVD